MNKIELLSPAKNKKCAFDAINCGADAIYIGAYDFGARANASNNLEDIKEVINFAHLFNVKVYVTINTILDDVELEQCKKLIWDLYEIKADGIIVQDFGIFYLSSDNKLPPISLHASTQCDNRDIEKIKFFEKLGLKRVILPRETSIEKIKKIKKETNIELEGFVHGANCVSYSGQCYMSYYIGKRSANRGECAQACRKKYSLVDSKGKYIIKNKYLLSLKDNNFSSHIDKLIKAGIISFKIEGRLKDSAYVKNITLFYHNLLKNYPRQSFGKIVSDFSPNPHKTFNRMYCDDYLFDKKDNLYNFITPKSTGEYLGKVISVNKDYFTIQTKEKIHPQDGLCAISDNELSGCLVNKVIENKIYPNKKINLKTGDKIYRNIDFEFLKQLENSKTRRKLDVKFQIFKDKIELIDERSNKIQYMIDYTPAQNKEKIKDSYIKSLSKTTDSPFDTIDIKFMTDEISFLPVSKINEIRRNMLSLLEEKILSNYKTKKQKPLELAKFPFVEGGYKLNIHNKKAKEFLELCNCKVSQMSFEKETPKKAELMRMRHCLKKALLDCNYKDKLFLEDEKKVKFPLEFDCKNCEMIVLKP